MVGRSGWMGMSLTNIHTRNPDLPPETILMFLFDDCRLYFLFAELVCFACSAMSLQASTANYLQLYFRFACAFSILAVVCTLSCRFPCNPARCRDVGPCAHGTVKDPCACCDVCAQGLGEECGGPYNGFGRCGVGLVCNINMTIHIALRPRGECVREERTMNTTSRNVTNHNNMTGLNATNATNPDGSDCITNATNVTTTSNVTTSTRGCREKCSIQFCSERARICSARGLEYSKVQARNDCQHTSCRACFMVIKPNCTRCPEPPNKKCLRRYYECVELHYTFGDVLLRLGDPTIHTVEGEILCHVPDVGDYSEDSTSH